jgi:hypothetical protein
MTVSGQISYEHRIVAQAFVDFSGSALEPSVALFGFADWGQTQDTITFTLDLSKIGLTSQKLLQGQITINAQIVQYPGAAPGVCMVTTVPSSPGLIIVQVIDVSDGLPFEWPDNEVSQLNVTVGIIDNGPFWPTSNP